MRQKTKKHLSYRDVLGLGAVLAEVEPAVEQVVGRERVKVEAFGILETFLWIWINGTKTV